MIFGDHSNDDPSTVLQHPQPADVLDVLTAVTPMLVTVVLDGNHERLPAHIEICERIEVTIVDHDLCLRCRQTSINEQQSQPRLFRRLGTTVHERQCSCRQLLKTDPRRGI
jgi:hypothetical protein